ncbi:hypothetical protein SODALDRAFT_134403 [Sodiomyces alkalinus F11]|uniref:Hemerythrin-like domain-containing protein n=1 Tax=Sodiomyces alkalinus (strain CBS 110278 / VKM F-3762 / F11) TaxID=1314773 RepID=A0A3N2PYL1_SODAK|nr:hypothetical protein SODALDRAFT_134403 [Sodiomyces alkalinus F11]ROT39621.1 hypothetical protein SODALDRAFT_134403 [Sodiomyces alkalinus F11]
MAGYLLLAIPTILVSLLFSRSPFLMSSSPTTGANPWADSPMKLITTPQYETNQADLFTTGATHMALLHNSILRGYNSIYHQAPHVQDQDKADFVGYALTWHKFVKSHHDDEEERLFAEIEKLVGDKTVFATTHREHQHFLPGLEDFHAYLASLTDPAQFSGAELRRIMSTFQQPFEVHFHSEIATLAGLASHPNAPREGTAEAAMARAVFKSWGKSTVSRAGTADVVPFFLMNLDRGVEGGMWANWPPMPAPIRWGLANVAGAWYGGRWRFASCDAQGRSRELYALESPASGS